jgi:hypothetical protein
MQPAAVADQQVGEGADIRPINLVIEKRFEGLDLEQTIGQSEIGKVADGTSTQATKKTRDPNPERFSQERDDPTLIATMTMKFHGSPAIGARRFGDDLPIGLLAFVLLRSPR